MFARDPISADNQAAFAEKHARNELFLARRSEGVGLAGQEKGGFGTTASKTLRDDHTVSIKVPPAVFRPAPN